MPESFILLFAEYISQIYFKLKGKLKKEKGFIVAEH